MSFDKPSVQGLEAAPPVAPTNGSGGQVVGPSSQETPDTRPVQVWTSEGFTQPQSVEVFAFRPRYQIGGEPERPCWLPAEDENSGAGGLGGGHVASREAAVALEAEAVTKSN